MPDQPLFVSAPPEISVHPPRRYRPRATLIILALNFLIFFLMTLADASAHPPLRTFLLRTMTGYSADLNLLLSFGASSEPLLRQGEYWRVVMPMFLHIGLLHLLINGYALLILGLLLEGVYGFGRFVFIYVAAGIGSSLLSMTFSGKISAGASGAILGIAGAMLVTGYLHREAVPPRWGRIFGRGIIPSIVLTLLFGLVLRQWIDNWGHLGGLVTGILLALVIPPPRREAVGGESIEQSLAAAVIPVAVVVLAMVAAAQNYPASRQALRLLEEGERLRSAQQIDQAVAKFREAARLAPHDERPHEGLGVICLEQKRTPEAIQEYEQALRLNPASPRALLGLAVALERQGELVKARQLFEAVLGRNPATPEGNELLADVCLEQKLYPEAVRHYQEALRLSPDMAVAHNNLAWLLATSEDPHFRDPKQALEHARSAVELSKWKEATFIDTLAEALYASGNFQEAVRVQTKALVLDPHNREYQDHMARYRKAAGG